MLKHVSCSAKRALHVFFPFFGGGGGAGGGLGGGDLIFSMTKGRCETPKNKRDQVMTGNGSSFQGRKKKSEISADYKE